MVSVQIMGGLGNQLFQYSAGYLAMRDFSTTLYLDTSWYNVPQASFLKYSLDKFKNLVLGGVESQPPSDSITLRGYFQDSRYFNRYREELLHVFDYPKTILPPGTVAIHIRRRDHVGLNWCLPDSYYINNIKKLSEYSPLIFTDDPEYCKRFNVPIYPSSDDCIHDMFTMSTADSFILSNSTYSCWAAYISGSNNVIYSSTLPNICNLNIAQKEWTQVP